MQIGGEDSGSKKKKKPTGSWGKGTYRKRSNKPREPIFRKGGTHPGIERKLMELDPLKKRKKKKGWKGKRKKFLKA